MVKLLRRQDEKQVCLSPPAWQTILQVLEEAVERHHPAFVDVMGNYSPSKRNSVRNSIKVIRETLKDA